MAVIFNRGLVAQAQTCRTSRLEVEFKVAGVMIARERRIGGVVPTLPEYRTVWRWHFYADVVCIPFVLWSVAPFVVTANEA